mgnify:CR=1 FL=1|jgi:hypothetical protein
MLFTPNTNAPPEKAVRFFYLGKQKQLSTSFFCSFRINKLLLSNPVRNELKRRKYGKCEKNTLWRV